MAEGSGRSGTRLLALLRPYGLLFSSTIAATVISSVLDGFTFVLLIPFLRTLFGNAALPAEGRSHVETVLNERSEEHTSELQSQSNLVCRLLLEKKKKNIDKSSVRTQHNIRD